MNQDQTYGIIIIAQPSDNLSFLQAAPLHLWLQTPYPLALWEELISRLKYLDGGASLAALKDYHLIHPKVDNVTAISELASANFPQEIFDFLNQQASATDLFCAYLPNMKNLSWKELDFATASAQRFVALSHKLQEQDFPHLFTPHVA